MPSRPRVIAFLVASPFELLDLAGPASVFSYPKVNAKPHYLLKILSTNSDTEEQSTAAPGHLTILSISPRTRGRSTPSSPLEEKALLEGRRTMSFAGYANGHRTSIALPLFALEL